jgi:hypothetical protein
MTAFEGFRRAIVATRVANPPCHGHRRHPRYSKLPPGQTTCLERQHRQGPTAAVASSLSLSLRILLAIPALRFDVGTRKDEMVTAAPPAFMDGLGRESQRLQRRRFLLAKICVDSTIRCDREKRAFS